MGFIDFFSTLDKNEKVNFPWIELNSSNQLEEIRQNQLEVCVIFKHSTRCGISRSVLSKFEKKFENDQEGVRYYYLDLLNFRTISNEISTLFDVVHQSPQMIVIKSGVVQKHASHYEILD